MDKNEEHTGFMGTYFDRSLVLRLARISEVVAWVVAVVYAADLILALVVFFLQYARGFWTGLGITDLFTNLLYIIERPFRGAVYFVVLMAIGHALRILMDVEDNLRRSARATDKHR